MKLKFVLFGAALISLNSFSTPIETPKYSKVTKKKVTFIDQSSDGEKLIAKSDCIGCHKVDKKLIGPSYLEIAKKYPLNDKNIAYLTGKIIKGGSGVWGSIPMSAHASLKKDDAKAMAKYILSLKK